MKTEIITIARAPVLPPKHELSRKRDHFSIDIYRKNDRMFTKRSAMSCMSSIIISVFKTVEVWMNAVLQNRTCL